MSRRAIQNRWMVLVGIIVVLCLTSCSIDRPPDSTEITLSTMSEEEKNMEKITYTALTPEEARQMSPNAYDLEMAQEKNLAESDIYDGNYLEVQAAYRALLNYYLCKTGNLDEYQGKMDSSPYNFLENTGNIYKSAGAFGRANIYIRNNIYVERLSLENLTLLLNGMQDNGTVEVSDKLLEMIQDTMVEVISVRYDDSEAKFEAIYDIGAFQTNTAPNDALVLAISYEHEYDDNGNIISAEKEDEKIAYVKELASQIEKEMSEKLGVKVSVFY